ncbi:MAG: cation-transporting P-type ATPase [Candidatus Methanomethyliaceae archaeon]
MNAHTLNIEKVIEQLNTSLGGLSEEEANKRLKKFGKNKLPEERKSITFLFLNFSFL